MMRSKTSQRLSEPKLLFSPTAWAKLIYLRDAGDTEIGGFGIAADPARPCHVTEIVLVKQLTTGASVEFDDEAVANYFEDQVARGLRPQQFGRIWIHTHPEMSANPSGTDEKTFARCFGRADWAIMFILSKTEDVYCRLSCNVGPGLTQEIGHGVDWTTPFSGSDHEAWKAEYLACVQPYRYERQLADSDIGKPLRRAGKPWSAEEEGWSVDKLSAADKEHKLLAEDAERLASKEFGQLSDEEADWLYAWEEYQSERLEELEEIRWMA